MRNPQTPVHKLSTSTSDLRVGSSDGTLGNADVDVRGAGGERQDLRGDRELQPQLGGSSEPVLAARREQQRDLAAGGDGRTNGFGKVQLGERGDVLERGGRIAALRRVDGVREAAE